MEDLAAIEQLESIVESTLLQLLFSDLFEVEDGLLLDGWAVCSDILGGSVQSAQYPDGLGWLCLQKMWSRSSFVGSGEG